MAVLKGNPWLLHGDTLGREPAPKNPNAHLGGWHNIPKDIIKTSGSNPAPTKNPLSISSQDLNNKGLAGLNPNAGFKKEAPLWQSLTMYQGEPVWHSNSPNKIKVSVKEAFPDSTPWHKTKIPSRPSGHYANWQPVPDRPGYFKTTMGYGNYGAYNWRVPGEFKTGKIDDYSGYGHNPTTGASWQYQLTKGIEDQDAWWGDRDAQDLLTFGSAGGRGDWEDNINYYGDEEDFNWYDFSAVDAARDKNYTAQEQLELLPENNNKDPWDTIGTYWSSLDASNPIPQGSATDFDRRDTDTWSDWMKSQPYSGFKNYWDYDRAATAYTKKQSAASEMYFDQDAGEWLLRTPDKYHSYNPGGSNYDPRFSMSFEQAKADKGWTSFVPQDHRSWKRGDKPLTPIPDRPIEIAHLEHKPDSRKHHTGVGALLNLEDAGGGLYDVRDQQWKYILGKDYVPGDPEENRRRWEDMHTRSGEHLSSNRYGTSGQTQTSLDSSDAKKADKFRNMYGQHPLIASTNLNDLGLYIGSPSTELATVPSGTKTKPNPTKLGIRDWVTDLAKKTVYPNIEKSVMDKVNELLGNKSLSPERAELLKQNENVSNVDPWFHAIAGEENAQKIKSWLIKDYTDKIYYGNNPLSKSLKDQSFWGAAKTLYEILNLGLKGSEQQKQFFNVQKYLK